MIFPCAITCIYLAVPQEAHKLAFAPHVSAMFLLPNIKGMDLVYAVVAYVRTKCRENQSPGSRVETMDTYTHTYTTGMMMS